jgi:hypothetical protein
VEVLVIEIDELKIPRAARAYAEQVIAVTDAACLERLDEEYADLCRRVVGKLARKRPTPLSRGGLRIWGSGVVYAVGQLNFLFDPNQELHLTADELSELLQVKKTTMANKGKLVRDTLKLSHFDTEFARQEMIDRNPLVWMLEIDDIIVDARKVPLALQVRAFELGLIPYVPGARPADG